MQGPSDTVAGTVIGGTCGFVKGLTVLTFISWATVGETALISAVGATVGFAVTSLLKYAKHKLKN